MSNIKGVGVDKGAVAKQDPVTVVVSPAGNEYDADTWSDANNLVAQGYGFKDGYPTGPGEEPSGKAKASGSKSESSSSSGSSGSS